MASIGWLAVAVVALSQYLSDEFATINDLGPTAIYLAISLLVAVGGRVGLVAAIVGTGFAGLLTLAALAWSNWFMLAAMSVFTWVNAMVVRELRPPA
ncbi:MAG: hypothetical protein OEW24_07795 [Chloroflexota bacterium]|nr:hypothetical protein [Chloroflexota bacterium]